MPTVLDVYEKLKSKLGEDEAKALLEFIETSVERRAATKEDLQQTQTTLRDELRQTQTTLRDELRQTQVTVTEQLHQMQIAFRDELQEVQTTLRDELRQTQVTVTEQLHQMQIAFRDELHRLDQKIEATKADIIKWTFGFWIGNMAVLTGIMFTLLRTFTGK